MPITAPDTTDALVRAYPVIVYNPDGTPFGGSGGSSTPATLSAGTDRSGTITTANAAQQVAPANASRMALTFQNTSDTAMRVTESGIAATATTGYLVGPGQGINVSTNRAISVFCTVAGKTFAATEV